MTAPTYKAGDRVRVLVDEPYSTDLKAGDVVTVIEVARKIDPSAPPAQRSQPIVVVTSNSGQFYLGLDAIEPFNAPAYQAGEPDDVVNRFFEGMIRADVELATIVRDADTALGAVEPGLSPQLGGAAVDTAEDQEGDGYSEPDFVSHATYTDPDGDDLDITYAEQECPTHGREAAFWLTINHTESVRLSPEEADGLLGFLYRHIKFSRRTEGDGTVAP